MGRVDKAKRRRAPRNGKVSTVPAKYLARTYVSTYYCCARYVYLRTVCTLSGCMDVLSVYSMYSMDGCVLVLMGAGPVPPSHPGPPSAGYIYLY
jgi:hypothetical protein